MIKKYFVSLRYPVPTALEDYLEEMASKGYFLNYVSQGGFFYYEFEETKKEKCCYMVDASPLDTGSYVKHIVDDGWEYLGKSGNVLIARKRYDKKRPEKPVNDIFRKRHCRNIAIAYLIIGIIFLGLCILSGYGIYQEQLVQAERMGLHKLRYLLQIVLQLPLSVCCFINAKKCFAYKPVIRRTRIKKVQEEITDKLEFLGEKEESEEKKEEKEEPASIFDTDPEEPELDFLKEKKKGKK